MSLYIIMYVTVEVVISSASNNTGKKNFQRLSKKKKVFYDLGNTNEPYDFKLWKLFRG